ncbi:MAG: hypothetical protein LBC85_10785 [Fibromonadaceae bacterium]|nr:hypothetical protein [Fibromonadaceae bacterium]
MLRNTPTLILLLAIAAYAQPSFMLGAKTFTLDFKGYSGFMLEFGGGTGIPMATGEELFFGVNSGFGFSGKSYSENVLGSDIKFDASSIVLPVKLFFSYGILGVSAGALLTFWDVKMKGNVLGINASDFDDKGTETYLDFGFMVFPVEKISIGFDIITSGSATGFALGVAYHFGRNRSQQYYDDYQEEKNVLQFRFILFTKLLLIRKMRKFMFVLGLKKI